MTTTNLLKIDMKSPHTVYRLKSGEKVPGVTTILSVLAKPALMGWYALEERLGILETMSRGRPENDGVMQIFNQLGKEMWTADDLAASLPTKENGKPQWFAETKRDKAADVGTIGHAHVEAFLKGCTLDPVGIDPELYAQALAVRDRFCEWWAEENLTIVHSEHVMVSEIWKCGGTVDIVARDKDGKLVLWDVKSSKPFFDGWPYPEFYGQTAAYARIFTETTGEPIDRIVIARTGKTAGDKGNKYRVDAMQRLAGESLFGHALGAYEAKYVLSRLCQ